MAYDYTPYPRSRDPRTAALDRVRRTSRFVTAGAFAAAAALVGVVAHELPGHSSTSATNPAPASAGSSPSASGGSSGSGSSGSGSSGSGSSGSGSSGSGSSGNGSSGNVAPAPTPTQQAPIAVSGGTGL
jgi:hypothetical protein